LYLRLERNALEPVRLLETSRQQLYNTGIVTPAAHRTMIDTLTDFCPERYANHETIH
jgi:hypothetical protein